MMTMSVPAGLKGDRTTILFTWVSVAVNTSVGFPLPPQNGVPTTTLRETPLSPDPPIGLVGWRDRRRPALKAG